MADFVAIKVAQRGEARSRFGVFKHPGRGQSNVDVPNISGRFAVKVRDYWLSEASRLRGHVNDIPDSAIVTQWKRNVATMGNRVVVPGPFPVEIEGGKTPLNQRIEERASIAEGVLLTSADALAFWDLVDAICNPLDGIRATPTSWDIFVESVKEAAQEAFDVSFDIVKFAAFAAAAVLLLRVVED